MPISLHVGTRADAYSNARMKFYPSVDNPIVEVYQVANTEVFRVPGWEPAERSYDVPPKGEGKDKERAAESAMRRARTAVRDIALCNHFTHFFTWTLSPEQVDRYDAEEVKKKVLSFLKNMTYRKGFSYVLVPELHKDGAIHMHGLCSLGELQAVPATNPHTGEVLETDNGQMIFNMLDWKLGYSTCIPIDENYERTCNYVTKYFTKGTQKIFGKWYYASRNLRKKPDTYVIPEGANFEDMQKTFPKKEPIPIYRDVCMYSVTMKELASA